MTRILSLLLTLVYLTSFKPCAAAESLWLEAEHFSGIRGFCWPMGDDKRRMRETKVIVTGENGSL